MLLYVINLQLKSQKKPKEAFNMKAKTAPADELDTMTLPPLIDFSYMDNEINAVSLKYFKFWTLEICGDQLKINTSGTENDSFR